MTWIRLLARRVFGPYLPYVSEEKAIKYMTINRLLYFVCAAGLGIHVIFFGYPQFKQEQLEKGMPVIEDKSYGHKVLREKNSKQGKLLEYNKLNGWTVMEYNREKYLAELEKQSFERAKAAQEKILKEGGELPPDAVRLID